MSSLINKFKNSAAPVALAVGLGIGIISAPFNASARQVMQQRQPETSVKIYQGPLEKVPAWELLSKPAIYLEGRAPDTIARDLLAAMERVPWAALGYADHYGPLLKETHPEELARNLFAAMKQKPPSALEHADRYGPLLKETHPEELARNLFAAMEQEPLKALLSADRYGPFVPETMRADLAQNLLAAMEQRPLMALEFTDRYSPFVQQTHSGEFAEALNRAAENLMASLQGAIFSPHHERYLEIYLGADTIATLKQIKTRRMDNLCTGRVLNNLHNESDSVRFDSVADYSASQLFELIVFGQEELWTSSYLGVFSRFVDRLKEESYRDIYPVFDQRLAGAPLVFLDMAVEYGTIVEAAKLIPPDRWNEILALYEHGLENGKAGSLVSLAELMNAMPDEELRQRMELFIQQKYDGAENQKVRDIYGLAGTYYNGVVKEKRIRIAGPEQYRLGRIDRLSTEKTFGRDGVHRQLHVYTGDRDGRATFAHFLARYKDNDKYHLQETKDYVKIASARGHPVEIYANIPGSSPDIIIDMLAGHEGASTEEVEFDAVIHRGHSYNLDNTMPYFSSHNSFMFLGSCGGFRNIEKLMEIAPGVHITATKQTGTMFVNDPLLYEMSEQIRKKGFVDWRRQQEYLDSLANPNRVHYVLPLRNVAQMINAKLHELAGWRKAEQYQTVQNLPTPGAASEPAPDIS
jgi:hypothetical protein